ncbi:MAG: hypothetical protein QW638_00070 [Candidatus Bathyarchaeia archaeon]|nr:hypothetical protein [Candidatus Bathyarchaeota archaeon]
MSWTLFWLGWSSLMAVGIMTLVWRENPYYRLVEHIIIGAGCAHGLMYGLLAVKTTALDSIMAGRALLVIPLFLAILTFGRLTPWGWVSRYPTALLTAIGIGILVGGALEAQIVGQVRSIGEEMIAAKAPFTIASALFAGIATLCAIMYFIYTREHTGVYGGLARFGRIIMMCGLGVSWGMEFGWFITALGTWTENVVNFIRALLGIPY